MADKIFTQDIKTENTPVVIEKNDICKYAGIISSEVSEEAKEKGKKFADEIEKRFVSDFEKSEKLYAAGAVDEKDTMVHVSSFVLIGDMIYMTYYASTKVDFEDPTNQTARFVYCPLSAPDQKTFIDIQSAGDLCGGKIVECVYDTILMKKDEDTLFIMWTAKVGGNYYRMYRTYCVSQNTLSEVCVNRFKAGEVTNDFSTTGIQSALTANEISFKNMYSDIGIMQKTSVRVEDGKTYYYTGAYSGDFTCIIKSTDFITWEYVSEPDFPNKSQWENATYVIGDKCYYFVRQYDEKENYGFLTSYDLTTKKWEEPVLIADCQSRSDFIVYKGGLYLFHAPIDREHIGIVKIDTNDLKNSEVILQAHMHTSCFYPFIQYFEDNELAMSYTVERKHIRLAKFDLKNYI